MATVATSKRLLAALIILVVVLAVSATSAYMLINNQTSNQINTALAYYYLSSSRNVRIVSQAPSITEIVFGLGIEDYLVGCTKYCDYPPKLLSMIAAGKLYNKLDWWNPSLEAIVNLKPSIVLLDAGVESHVKLAENLAAQGIPFLLLSRGNSISQIELTIRQLGSFFSFATSQKSIEAAEKLVEIMEDKMSKVNETVKNSGEQPKKVLLCVWIDFDYNTLYSVGKPTFLNEIIERAGGINIYSNIESAWPQDSLTLEKAQYNDPDVIVILDHHALLDPTTTLQRMGNSPLAGTPAYQNGNVFFLQGQADNLFARPGPRVAEGVELLANILFPNVFNASFPSLKVINDGNYKNYLSSLVLESSSAHSLATDTHRTPLLQTCLCPCACSSILTLARHPSFFLFLFLGGF